MFKKEIKKITKAIVIGSIILVGTAGVYATNSNIQQYISNFSSSDSEIGKLIRGFFDNEGYIETEFIKNKSIIGGKLVDNTIGEAQISDSFVARDSAKLGGSVATDFQKKVINTCSGDKVIQSINQNGSVVCVGSGTINGGAVGDNLGNHIATQNIQLNGKYLSNDGGNEGISVDNIGKVGIGTTNPRAYLEMVTPSYTTPLIIAGTEVNNGITAGQSSIALGDRAEAGGDFSLAIGGMHAQASGSSSVAMGVGTQASGPSSVAIGDQTKASSAYSTAMGYQTKASSLAGTIVGRKGQTASDDVFAVAYSNDWHNQNTPGAGLVFQVKQNGNVKIKGKATSTSTVSGDSATTLVTKDYVDANAGGSGGKFVDGQDSTQAVYTGGNVGIGTDNPSVNLHIDSTADVQGNSTSNGAFMVGQTTGEHVSIDRNEIMAKNGNNTSPLHFQLQGGDTEFGGSIKSKVPTDGTIMKWNSNGFMKKMTNQGGVFLGSDSSVVLHAGDHLNHYEADLGIANTTTDENLWLTSDGDVNIVTGYQNGIGNSKRTTFKSNGNVGIGTNSPSAKLEVKGSTKVSGRMNIEADNSSYGGFVFQSSNELNYAPNKESNMGWWMNYRGTENYDQYRDLTIGNGKRGAVMKIDGSSSRVGIGTTTPSEKLEVNGNIKTTGRNVYFGTGNQKIYGDNSTAFYVDSNHSRNTQMIFRDKENTIYGRVYGTDNGNNFGFLDGDGNRSYRAYKDHTTYFYINNVVQAYINSDGSVHAKSFIYTSDRRLKKGIETLNSSLEKINKLRGVSFNWKDNNKKEIGLIAQEVEEVYPDLVDTDKESGMKSVKYGNVVAILIEGIKELYNKVVGNSDKIVVLEKENVELKNRVGDLEEKMSRLEGKIDMLVR